MSTLHPACHWWTGGLWIFLLAGAYLAVVFVGLVAIIAVQLAVEWTAAGRHRRFVTAAYLAAIFVLLEAMLTVHSAPDRPAFWLCA